MREQVARVFARGLGQDVRVEFRPVRDEVELIDDLPTRAALARKLGDHRKLMSGIFADLISAGAPLPIAMKFLPKDAIVSICEAQPDFAGAK